MPRFIVKIGEDRYLLWSTVVDAPVTCGMSRDEMKQELIRFKVHEIELEVEGMLESADDPPARMSLDRVSGFNRAGDNEESLSKEELIAKFWDVSES